MRHVLGRAHVADDDTRHVHAGAFQHTDVPGRLPRARGVGDDRRASHKGSRSRRAEQPLGQFARLARGADLMTPQRTSVPSAPVSISAIMASRIASTEAFSATSGKGSQ